MVQQRRDIIAPSEIDRFGQNFLSA